MALNSAELREKSLCSMARVHLVRASAVLARALRSGSVKLDVLYPAMALASDEIADAEKLIYRSVDGHDERLPEPLPELEDFAYGEGRSKTATVGSHD